MFFGDDIYCIQAIWTIFIDKQALLISTKIVPCKMQHLARILVHIDFPYIDLGLAIDSLPEGVLYTIIFLNYIV